MSSHAKLPQLNTWDVTEFMPGARPDVKDKNRRPTPAEREEFESRSIQIYEWEKSEQQTYTKKKPHSHAEVVQQEIDLLFEMFPNVERSLVHAMYTDTGLNLTKAVEQLTAVSEDVDPAVQESLKFEEGPPIVNANSKDWPVLTTNDGWEIANVSSLDKLEAPEGAGDSSTWRAALDKKPGGFEAPLSPPFGVDRYSKLTGYKYTGRKPGSKRDHYEDYEREDEDNDIAYKADETYKLQARLRRHNNKYAKRNSVSGPKPHLADSDDEKMEEEAEE